MGVGINHKILDIKKPALGRFFLLITQLNRQRCPQLDGQLTQRLP